MTERWWADLEPQAAVRRPALVKAFAARSIERFKASLRTRRCIDVESLTKQINGFSVKLVERDWAKPAFTVDGIRCMQAPVKDALGSNEDLRGWARVLDVYGRICDPLAHYVVSYYPPLYDLRPTGLPRNVMSSLKDSARFNAVTALRNGLLRGFGEGHPLLGSQERVTSFIAAIAAGAPPEADRHERDVVLAYAAELDAYAKRITDDPWKVLDKEPLLNEPDVVVIARKIAERADEIRSRYSTFLPTAEELKAEVDELLAPVLVEMAVIAEHITAIELAQTEERTSGSRELAKWKRESGYYSQAYDSTRDELIALVGRAHKKTVQDVLSMFFGRVAGLRKRDPSLIRGPVRASETEGKGREPTAPSPTRASDGADMLTRLRKTAVQFRLEMPNRLGEKRGEHNTAEFDAIVEVLRRGAVSLDEIRTYCIEHWPVYEATAVASDPESLTDNVLDLIGWTAKRSGLK